MVFYCRFAAQSRYFRSFPSMEDIGDVINILDGSLPPVNSTKQSYMEWITNAPFLYDYLQLKSLDRVSNTVQWLKGALAENRKEYTTQHLLLSTKALEGDQNAILDYYIQLSNHNYEADIKLYKEEGSKRPSHTATDGKLLPSKWVNHDEPILKCRYMPQNDQIVACGGPTGKVSVFYLTNNPSTPTDIYCHPDYTLLSHKDACSSLDWCVLQQKYLATGGKDRSVCIWDLQSISQSMSSMPSRCFNEQKDKVNTVVWHPLENNVVCAGGDDCNVFFYDIRQAHSTSVIQAHSQPIQAISFNPVERYLFATASDDKTIGLWDQRNTSRPLHSLVGHKGSVNVIQWSPFSTCILASGSSDCRVHLWDISQVGKELPEDQLTEGPPELVFIHGGHTAKVNDLSWNPNDMWTIASVGDDSSLQVWRVANSLINQTCCQS